MTARSASVEEQHFRLGVEEPVCHSVIGGAPYQSFGSEKKAPTYAPRRRAKVSPTIAIHSLALACIFIASEVDTPTLNMRRAECTQIRHQRFKSESGLDARQMP